MQQIEIKSEGRTVISTSNAEGCEWSSRLYVNNGETATLVCAKHQTEAAARRWAARKLAA